MSYTPRLAIVVPVGVLQNSSEVFTILDPDSGGAATFSVPLSADGLEPVTHYAAYTVLEQATYDALTTMTTTQFRNYVNGLADQRGRTQIASATAFKNAVEIEDINNLVGFQAFITSLGLQRIEPDFSQAASSGQTNDGTPGNGRNR